MSDLIKRLKKRNPSYVDEYHLKTEALKYIEQLQAELTASNKKVEELEESVLLCPKMQAVIKAAANKWNDGDIDGNLADILENGLF